MKQSTREAYAEIDIILNLMDTKYISKIPQQLRNMFKTEKAPNYSKDISLIIPLDIQGVSQETLNILAVLNYNYWCEDENEKQALIRQYYDNQLKSEKEIQEKYNPDNIFKKDPTYVEVENNNTSITVENEKTSIFSKFINFIKNIFRK